MGDVSILENQTFGYDAQSRLTSYARGTLAQSYLYDANGNRIQYTENGTPTTYQIDAASNRLLSRSGLQNTAYAYDDTGNVINDGTFTYAYNGRNRLLSVFPCLKLNYKWVMLMKFTKTFWFFTGLSGIAGAIMAAILGHGTYYYDTHFAQSLSPYWDRSSLDMVILMLWPSSIFGLAEAPGNETEIYMYSMSGNVLLYMFIGAFIWLGIKKHRALLILPALTIISIWWWALTLK